MGIDVEVTDRIAKIVIDRPKAPNSMTPRALPASIPMREDVRTDL